MESIIQYLPQLWESLLWPLIRLFFYITLGLLAASLLEAMQWNKKIGRFAQPLARIGNMPETVAMSFAAAFISGVAANTMLSEAYSKQTLSKKELIIGNLFNSLPTYFLHLPTMFFITLPLIKSAAFIYVGLTLTAAVLRTSLIIIIGRFILTPTNMHDQTHPKATKKKPTISEVYDKVTKRFKKRMFKIAKFTIPIYILIFIIHRIGFFREAELFFAGYLENIPFISPQSIGIITLHLAAELTAGLAAAGALLQDGTLSVQEIVVALLIGNIVSSPLRAVRHQFPYFAGIFSPKLALELIAYSQTFRVGSIIFVTIVYIILN